MTSRDNIDAAAGGAFLDLTIAKSKALVEKMVSNQGWSDERLQPRTKSTHTVKETDMIIAKLDLLLKHLGERAEFKKHRENYAHAMESHFTCEVCGNDGHSGNDCPETHEDCAYLNNNNNGYRPQQGGQGWNQPRPPFQGGNNYNPSYNSNFNSNQPPLRELVLGQVKINKNINKKLLANDKSLESLNVKLETLSSTLKTS